MQTSTNLALNAKNTAVAEFDHLVNNKAVQSAASKAEDFSGEVVASTKQISNMSMSDLSKASAYVNSIPSKSNISNEVNNATNLVSDRLSDVSQSLQQATLSTDLYDKALSLPEANAVSLLKDYSINYSPYANYGKFEGTAVYKDFSGTIDDSVKDVKNISGWVNINKQHEQYATITNNSVSYIVGVNDIKPEPTVSDFQPLYDILNSNNVCSMDQSIIDDIKSAQSQACTFKDISSSLINSNASDIEKYTSGAINEASSAVSSNGIVAKLSQDMTDKLNTWTNSGSNTQSPTEDAQIDNAQDVIKNSVYSGKEYTLLGLDQYIYTGVLYPKQISHKSTDIKNDSVYNNVQAMIYDLSSNSTDIKTLEESPDAVTTLLCYQQPESISYSAACQFEQPSPRGSQQPFQFYVAANAMSLNFTLKWHVDELRTLYKSSNINKSITIQDIAEISEGFTRPWERGSSIEPKLCKVILPGVQHIGYITEAQISYSGDMSGDYSTGGGVLTESNGIVSIRKPTSYFYSQIEVTFQMIIIKDINLRPKSDKADYMGIADKFSYAPNTEADQSSSGNSTNEEADQGSGDMSNDKIEESDKKNNSGEVQKSTTSAVESAVSSNATTPTGEVDKKAISAYTNDDGSPMFVGDGKAYKADKDSTEKGIVKSKDGSEMFITNGGMYSVVPEGSYGNKQYTDSNGDTQLASYSQENVLYENASGGYCYYEEEGNESTLVSVSYVTPYTEVIESNETMCYWSGA